MYMKTDLQDRKSKNEERLPAKDPKFKFAFCNRGKRSSLYEQVKHLQAIL